MYKWGGGGRDALCFALLGPIREEEDFIELYLVDEWQCTWRG